MWLEYVSAISKFNSTHHTQHNGGDKHHGRYIFILKSLSLWVEKAHIFFIILCYGLKYIFSMNPYNLMGQALQSS